MSKILRPLAFLLALAFLVLTFVNASWLADSPRGYLKLVAPGGAGPLALRGAGDCPGTRIEEPLSDTIPQTVPAFMAASGNGAQMVAVDVVPTADGKIALYPDAALDCRTDGTGPARAATLAQLKALDAGHDYSADGGKTFPLRGKGRGLIPSLEEALQVLPEKPILFRLGSEAGDADKLIAALKAAGRDVSTIGDGFQSEVAAALGKLRAAFPKAWAFSMAGAQACTAAYRWQGWLGLTPAACTNSAILVPLNRQWAFAGWPNRLQARMSAANARVVLTGPQAEAGLTGLDLPEQIKEVPVGYTGYLWVDDIVAVGPAVRPTYGKRNPVQEEKFQAAMTKRRAGRD